MFKKILVPVDGSETSWRALNNALEIGRKFNSEIVVVNVIQPYNNAALLAVPLDHSTISRGNSELERIGDKVLEYAKNIVGDYPHEVSYDMEVGHPSERIIALAKKSSGRCNRYRLPRSFRHCRILPWQRQQQGFAICGCACADCEIK